MCAQPGIAGRDTAGAAGLPMMSALAPRLTDSPASRTWRHRPWRVVLCWPAWLPATWSGQADPRRPPAVRAAVVGFGCALEAMFGSGDVRRAEQCTTAT